MASGCVHHTGEVVHVSGMLVRVRLRVHSACSGCGARRACGMSESAEREVEVRLPGHGYRVGDEVVVEMRAGHALLAVLLGYVAPFGLLLLSLVVLRLVGVGEGLSALVSLGLLAPYYLLLYGLRGRVARRFDFTISSKA